MCRHCECQKEMIWCAIFLHVAFGSHRIVLNLVNYLKMSLWWCASYRGLYTYLKCCFNYLVLKFQPCHRLNFPSDQRISSLEQNIFCINESDLVYLTRKIICTGIVIRVPLFSSISSYISILYSVFINPKCSSLVVEKHRK